MEKIKLEDLGTDFEATIKEGSAVVDISAATALEIEFTAPGGATTTKTAVLVNTGTDGKLHYVREAGFITRRGIWSYIGIATFSPTQKFHGIEPIEFEVV